MREGEKARKYDWLMRQYVKLENQLSAVQQLPIEEQSAYVDKDKTQMYDRDNQMKVNNIKKLMNDITEQVRRLGVR
tara:strand:+ start:5319 stop:5546 length:228 start_codon:yes stop_codon:yes gene_type:complete